MPDFAIVWLLVKQRKAEFKIPGKIRQAIDWYGDYSRFFTNVSEQPIGLIFEGQA